MISKNISVNVKDDQDLPFKETFIIIHASNKKLNLYQKYINPQKNQKIELKFEDCKRLMNLLFYYVFNGDFQYSKDKMIVYKG